MQTHYFVKFYGDALDDTGVDVELAPDGGYVVAGTTVRPTGDTDIMLIIVNNYGIQKTQTVYYGEEGDEICTGLLLVDDGYVITGSVTNGGEENVLLVKIGTDGVLDGQVILKPQLMQCLVVKCGSILRLLEILVSTRRH